jgi:DNA-binding transcriptional LysR family regulator
MYVSFQQLRAFASVARYGSFTRAAIALHTSQSALSTRIAQLEKSIGARLFDRSTRSVR